MGKILIAELALCLALIVVIAATDSLFAKIAFVGIYVISGYRRKYYAEIDIDYAIGIVQNLTAIVAAYFLWFALTYRAGAMEGKFVHYSFFAIPLGIIQMLGIRRFLLRVSLFVAFVSLWMLGLGYLTSLPAVHRHLNGFLEFGILLLGMRVFEVGCDSILKIEK